MSTVRVVLVRHGEAAHAWGTDPDPGLSPRGHRQAAAVADELASLGPLAVVTSPLRRCRETAEPLAGRWGVEPVVRSEVGEIPTPSQPADLDRAAWLGVALAGRWSDLPDELLRWRDRLVAAVAGLTGDTIVCTHFVAINAVVGRAVGDDRATLFRPDNCSRTVVEVADGRLVVVRRGAEADTEVG